MVLAGIHLRKLFVPESVAVRPDGFTFTINNPGAPVDLSAFALQVEGRSAPAQSMILRLPSAEARLAADVSSSKPLTLPFDRPLTVEVLGMQPGRGPLVFDFELGGTTKVHFTAWPASSRPNGRDMRWLTGEIEDIQAAHRARIAALYAGQHTQEVISIAGLSYGRWHGLAGNNDTDMLEKPEVWLDDVLADMAEQAEAAADPITFRPLVIEVDPLGVHYIDALFGARVHFHERMVWNEELDGDLSTLTMPDLAQSQVFQQSLALARRAVEVTQGRVLVTTPVLSCPINIAINLFGQRFLEALVAEPPAARHALRVVTDVIIACHRAFSQAIPNAIRRNFVTTNRYTPPGFGEIDGCAVQLVSARTYTEFLAPLDAEILAVYPHGGIMHNCGAVAHHIPTWRAMRELRGIQLNDRAAEDLQLFFAGLRRDQILYVAPTTSMTIARILEITRGQRLILQAPLDATIPVSS